MAEYLAEKNGTGEQINITTSGSDGFYVRTITEYQNDVTIIKVINPGPNYPN